MAIYTFYIENYMHDDDGNGATYHKDKKKVYTVPITDPEMAFTDPSCKTEMGKAGSLEFSVMPNHPYYDCWCQFKTIMYLEYAGMTIFRGRVLTIDTSPLTGMRKIHCEGDLAFLLDSYQEMTHEEKRKEIEILPYLKQIRDQHNDQVGMAPAGEEEDKKIHLGNVPGQYSENISDDQKLDPPKKKYGSKSWEQSMSALENLSKEYGGYFRLRWDKNNKKSYLDWLKNYFRKDVNEEPIAVTKNLIDINSSAEVDNVFTVLIPVGSREGKELYLNGYQYKTGKTWEHKYIRVPDLVTLANEGVIPSSKLNSGYHTRSDYLDAIDNYNIVFKVQSFSNADTQKKLFEYAIDWMLNNYIGGLTSFTVSALDLYHLNPDIYTHPYFAGDRVQMTYPNPEKIVNGTAKRVTITRTILSADIYPHNPEKNSYSIGIPNQILNKTYGTSKNKKGSSGVPDQNKDPVAEAKAKIEEIDDTLWAHVMSAYYNHDMYKEYDPDEVESMMISQYLFLKKAKDDPKGAEAMCLDAMQQKFWMNNLDPESYGFKKACMIMYGKGIQFLNTEQGVIAAQMIGGDGTVGELDLSKVLLGKDGEGNNVAINLDGLSGLFSMFGLDGSTGDMFKSLDISSFQQFLKFFQKPKTGDDPDNPTETVKVDGEKGTGEFGGEKVENPETHEKEQQFKVTLSKSIRYKGSDEQWHDSPTGSVSAEDFYLTSVPSFAAEFAYIDTVVVRDLTAAKAKIDNLTADDIDATTIHTERMGSKRGYFNRITVTPSGAHTGAVTAASFEYRPGGGGQDAEYLETCLIGMETGYPSVDEEGVVTFKFTRATGSNPLTITFDQASTQFYKTGVEAARTSGYRTGWGNAAAQRDWPDSILLPNVQQPGFTGKWPTTVVDGEAVELNYQIYTTAPTSSAKGQIEVRQVNNQSVIARLENPYQYDSSSMDTRYGEGWRNAENLVSYPTEENLVTDYIQFKYPPNEVDGPQESRTYTLINQNKNYADLRVRYRSQNISVARLTHNRYNGGWAAAKSCVELPTEENLSSPTVRVKYPPDEVDGGAESRIYTLIDESKNTAILRTRVGNENVTVGALSHNRYNGGWAAAAAQRKWPDSVTGSTTQQAGFTGKWPTMVVDGDQVELNYQIYTTAPTSSVKGQIEVRQVNNQSVIARLENPYQYDSQQSYAHSATITRAYTSEDERGKHYSAGQLYYKDSDGSYYPAGQSGVYWYYSQTAIPNVAASPTYTTVHYN